MNSRAAVFAFKCLVLIVGAACARAAAIAPELLLAVPTDAWVVIAVDPPANRPTALDAAAFLMDEARRVGLAPGLEPDVAMMMDAVGSLPVLASHPMALCLLSAEAQPLGQDGFRLSRLEAALVVLTRGDNEAIQNRIQYLLNTHVNDEIASFETVPGDGYTSYRLRDSRLPDWAEVQWGNVGDLYVFALGSGVFGRIAATAGSSNGIRPGQGGLAASGWFAPAHDRCRGDTASLEWTIRFDAIRSGLRPVMQGKPDEVLRALGLADVDRGLWTAGTTGRAVEVYALLHTHPSGAAPAEDRFTAICRPPTDDWIDTVVPPQARSFAVIDYSPRDLVLRTRDAYLASQSPSNQASLRRTWADIERETDTSVNRDLLMQLGQRIVIHDEPQAAFGGLGIPLARTVLVEIAGSTAAVQTWTDRVFRYWQRHLQGPASDWSGVSLHRAPDGIWYLQAGLYGPAWAVTDRWLVIGYSPVAVRQNVAFLQGRTQVPATAGEERPAP